MYDEKLAGRIRRSLAHRGGVTEKRMFGGLAFLLDGKMVCGILKGDLMVRVGPEQYEAALGNPRVRPMGFAGRPMRGYVFVDPAGCRAAGAVAGWVESAVGFVSSLNGGAGRAEGSGRD